MIQPSPRRVFLMTLAASDPALATGAQAVALGYLADAKRMDVKKFPKSVAGQNCISSALYHGKPADKAGGCPMLGARQVAGAGWCSAWAKNA